MPKDLVDMRESRNFATMKITELLLWRANNFSFLMRGIVPVSGSEQSIPLT